MAEKILLLCFSECFFVAVIQKLVHLGFVLFCVHLGSPAIHCVPSDCVLRKGLLNMRKLDIFLTDSL